MTKYWTSKHTSATSVV